MPVLNITNEVVRDLAITVITTIMVIHC